MVLKRLPILQLIQVPQTLLRCGSKAWKNDWKGIGWWDRKTLGWSLSRTGGTWGFHDSWYLPVNNQLRSNTQKTSGWLWEDHESAKSWRILKENYQHHCHPLSISSFVTCIISSHMGCLPGWWCFGRQSRQSTERAWEDMNQSGMTVYHMSTSCLYTICLYITRSLDL